MTREERELSFAIAFLVDAYDDLEKWITLARAAGITPRWADCFHRDLVRLSQRTDDATWALTRIVTESQMEKFV